MTIGKGIAFLAVAATVIGACAFGCPFVGLVVGALGFAHLSEGEKCKYF